jgi:hypothetical protein
VRLRLYDTRHALDALARHLGLLPRKRRGLRTDQSGAEQIASKALRRRVARQMRG